MKQLTIRLFAALSFSAFVSLPVHAQNGATNPPPEASSDADPQWKQLADRIIEQYKPDSVSFSGNDLNEEQLGNLTIVQKSYQDLGDLPEEQTIEAFRYMLLKTTNTELRSGMSADILLQAPSSDNVRFVLPFFEKLPDAYKAKFLSYVVVNAVMLRPEIPEFREFATSVLKQAAQGVKLSRDLVGQAAVLLANGTTSAENQWMHQALAHYPNSNGVWNALTQLNDLTPGEVEQAQQLFIVNQELSGRRLTLAAALSPYDPKMRELVRQIVETELKAKADTQLPAPSLIILRFWEVEQARPYLLRMLHVKNEELKHTALPLLAARAPQEVLRIAQQPGAQKKFVNITHGLALVSLLHPQFKLQITRIIAKIEEVFVIPGADPQYFANEMYDSVVGELQQTGLSRFNAGSLQ